MNFLGWLGDKETKGSIGFEHICVVPTIDEKNDFAQLGARTPPLRMKWFRMSSACAQPTQATQDRLFVRTCKDLRKDTSKLYNHLRFLDMRLRVESSQRTCGRRYRKTPGPSRHHQTN